MVSSKMCDLLKECGQHEELQILLKELSLCNDKLHSFQCYDHDTSYFQNIHETKDMTSTLSKIYHLHPIRSAMYASLLFIETNLLLLTNDQETKRHLQLLQLLYCPFGILREKQIREFGHRFFE